MNNGVLEKKLLCVVPRGFDQRDDKQLIKDLSFKLALNQPVAFNLYQAEHERSDVQGALLSMDYKNFSLLAPIETELRTEKNQKAVQNIDVQLQMELSSLEFLNFLVSKQVSGLVAGLLNSMCKKAQIVHDLLAEGKEFIQLS